ncbi:MAG: YggT family protein [Pseudomonadota bacterium]|jgi:Predicted integral membrane protein|nr:MAG: YggT family protein [Pseudomonadota bacterium]
MSAIIFIIETLLKLAFVAFLLRLLLQLSRADFRNPVCQAIVRLTNPLIVPLRRILPPAGRIDTASVVAVVLIALVEVGVAVALRGFGLPPLLSWIQVAALEIARTVLWTYFYAIFVYALLSLIAPGGYSPVQSVLADLCEPVLRPFRRLIPSVAGLDLSPLWAIIAIQAILILLR